MDRAISLAALIPAMIAITPVAAQAVESAPPPASNTSAVVNAALDESDAPKPRTVRIAGRTVKVESLPSDDDAKPAVTPNKPKARARR